MIKISKMAPVLGILTVFSPLVSAAISLSGELEIDTDYINDRDGFNEVGHDTEGVLEVSLSVAADGDRGSLFGEVVVEADITGNTSVEDLWVRLTSDNWGVQIGRFEGMDLFSLGTDTIHNVIGETNFFEADNAGSQKYNSGQIMIDYSTGAARLELIGVYGEEADGEPVSTDESALSGVRPAVSIALSDHLDVAFGYDYLASRLTKIYGHGVFVRYATDKWVLKMNVASGESRTGDTTNWKNTSFNVNLESGRYGLGYTRSDNEGGDTATTVYGRYHIPSLLGIEGASGAIGLSIADANSVDLQEIALRYRISYEF